MVEEEGLFESLEEVRYFVIFDLILSTIFLLPVWLSIFHTLPIPLPPISKLLPISLSQYRSSLPLPNLGSYTRHGRFLSWYTQALPDSILFTNTARADNSTISRTRGWICVYMSVAMLGFNLAYLFSGFIWISTWKYDEKNSDTVTSSLRDDEIGWVCISPPANQMARPILLFLVQPICRATRCQRNLFKSKTQRH